MATLGTQWTSILDLVDTGQDVSDALDLAFGNIDTDITALDTNKADSTDLAVVQKELTIRSDEDASDVDTVIVAGIYTSTGVNAPATETSGLVYVKDYDGVTKIEQSYLGSTGIEYTRTSALGDGSDWTAWTEKELSARVTANEDAIVVLQTPAVYADLEPQVTPPAHVEGRFYYNANTDTFNLMGKFVGIEVEPGHGQHLHVINKSGSLIQAGTPVRIQGTFNTIPQIVPAQADTFENAVVAGWTVIDVPNDAESAIAESGVLSNVDTSLLSAGKYFLSDAIAGGMTQTAPAIRTEVGGVLVSDAAVGKFRVDIKINQDTPTVLGVLQGQAGTGVYTLTATPVPIANYASATSVVTLADATTGRITLPNDGSYRVNFTANIEFAAVAATRGLVVDLYDITGVNIDFPYDKSIPRDSTKDSLSFNWVLPNEVADRVHEVQISSPDNFDVTLTKVSFDIESISIT